jgi:hypothetical protein
VWGVAAVACGMSATVAAQDSATGPRVRSSSPLIRDVLTRGAVQSPTFRRLITAINDTDGIVYVETGQCGHHVHNCLLFSITSAGGFRFLRIVMDTNRFDHPERSNELVASMGHELRHAVEVLTEPHVRSTIDMFSLYANQAAAHDGHFETQAAVRTGEQVLNDLAGAPAAVLLPHRVQ